MNSFDRRIRAFSINTASIFILVLLLIPLDFSSNVKYYLMLSIYFLIPSLPYLFGSGQNFGKRIQKLKVVKNTKDFVITNYKIPNRFLLMLRELTIYGFIIVTFGFYIIIAGIIASNHEDGRTIHDYIFKTRVIPVTKYTTDTIEIGNRTESAQNSLKGFSYRD